MHQGEPYYGTIKWIGTLLGYDGYCAVVELVSFFLLLFVYYCVGSFEGVNYFSFKFLSIFNLRAVSSKIIFCNNHLFVLTFLSYRWKSSNI